MIVEKQTAWGTQFLERLSKDLKEKFPDMEGFSKTNIYIFSTSLVEKISPQADDQITQRLVA
jgi:hypothetical protein